MPSLDRPSVALHYEERGEGPPLLLGHSFLCSGEMWASQVGPLSQHAHVVNPDFRGHGRSGPVEAPFDLYDLVDDQLAVLDHLGIDRAVWAGLSIGGMVALRAALVHPDRVGGLILLDTDAGAETAGKKLRYRAMGWGVRLLGTRPFLPAIARLMFGSTTRRTRPGLVAAWKHRFATVHVPSMLRFLDALVERDSVVDRLGEVRTSTLVIVGEEDAALPPDRSEEIAARISHARLVTVPEAGHLVALENPHLVTEAMIEFLDEAVVGPVG